MWAGGHRQTTTTPPTRIFRRGTKERTVYSDGAKYTVNTRGTYSDFGTHIQTDRQI